MAGGLGLRALLVAAAFASAAAFAPPSQAQTSSAVAWVDLGAVGAVPTYVRFTNASTTAGTATVTLYNASSGIALGTYTSASIAPFASLQIDVASIVAAATPTVPATNLTLTASIQSSFNGNVQTFVVTNGALNNLTPCPDSDVGVIGGVPGPNNQDLLGGVRLMNTSDIAHAIALNVYKSDDGTKLGGWTSPTIPAHGSYTVSTAGLFAAITLAPGTTLPALTLETEPDLHGVSIDVLAQPRVGGALTNLGPRCALSRSSTANVTPTTVPSPAAATTIGGTSVIADTTLGTDTSISTVDLSGGLADHMWIWTPSQP